jgi:hypothetical protein
VALSVQEFDGGHASVGVLELTVSAYPHTRIDGNSALLSTMTYIAVQLHVCDPRLDVEDVEQGRQAACPVK